MKLWGRILEALKSREQKEAEEAARVLLEASRAFETRLDRSENRSVTFARDLPEAPQVAQELRRASEKARAAAHPSAAPTHLRLQA